MTFKDEDERPIRAIRLLSAGATFNSKLGHPGVPMGMAPVTHVLFSRFLRCSPAHPGWLNRDFWNGRACILQYIMLHLLGYEITMDYLKNFRQLDSITPGHPENFETPGVEVTTGLLGQGIANAVGLAIAQAHTAAVFNRPGFSIDNFTYCFLGDGCLQEGVASEASSLAGHLQLGNLICIYDDNRISIDRNINCSFTEDVVKRYGSYGWHVLWVKTETQIWPRSRRPFNSTHGVHGNPFKADNIKQLKSKWGFNADEAFHVPEEVYKAYQDRAAEGLAAKQTWGSLLAKRLTGTLPQGWEADFPAFSPSDPTMATRNLSETVLSNMHVIIHELIGGLSDLTLDFQAPGLEDVLRDYSGLYLRYGVREHTMGAIMNGFAAYGIALLYGGTFLNFVSYAAGAARLSALSRLRIICLATHDSMLWDKMDLHISPSRHQCTSVRCPTVQSGDLPTETKQVPLILSLILSYGAPRLRKLRGGYVVSESDSSADITLVGTGSEVALCVETAGYLSEQHGLKSCVVSLPCWEHGGLTHQQFGIDTFGASFTKEGVAKRAIATI
ncbi:hypothetical protein LCI18_001357 [Fusarium solani-melongenae]|uniref:Uncharacterized protein n=1 Tax=Fusarium solani subsp. cucurbitae TaxID=2747967 RepID=A0ACD3YN22_FUSSC|nr:hypothetical protein LCI18_001357 [Fusarium solani-melongenae]